MNHAADAARENVQTIVWVIEIVTLITTALVAWFVWRISKRATKKKSGQED
jgi:heme/copper-type cytochrome/quinol oxidase subunit 2